MRKCQHSFRQNKKCRTWQIICFKEKRHGILEKYKKSRIFLNLNNISSYIYDITSYIYDITSYGSQLSPLHLNRGLKEA